MLQRNPNPYIYQFSSGRYPIAVWDNATGYVGLESFVCLNFTSKRNQDSRLLVTGEVTHLIERYCSSYGLMSRRVSFRAGSVLQRRHFLGCGDGEEGGGCGFSVIQDLPRATCLGVTFIPKLGSLYLILFNPLYKISTR